jgi:rSAM/selenodomain-associated transferase 2
MSKKESGAHRLTLGIIIPTLNEEKSLRFVLESVRQMLGVDKVIVVDGGSKDSTLDVAKEYDVTLIKSEPGRGLQLNAGWQACDTDLICFLHADTIMPKTAPQEIRRTFALKHVQSTAFKLSFYGKNLLLRLIAYGANLRTRFFRLPYGDQAITIRRNTLQELGGLPEWNYLEDLWLMQQAPVRKGFRLHGSKVKTSPRRYLDNGIFKTAWKHQVILWHYFRNAKPEIDGR